MAMTRNSFLKTLAGATLGSGVLLGWPERLLQAQEKTRIPVRSTRIRDAEVFPFQLKQKMVIKIALGSTATTDNVLVRLRTEDGVVGFGEASPYPAITGETQQTNVAIGRNFAEMVRGRDPFNIARMVADMEAFAPGNPSIKAAFEMALWDICGKITGQPVRYLLGNYRDSFETDLTIFIDTPAVTAQAARDVVSQGFKVVKIKVGESPEKDAERLRAVREAVGPDIGLRIDANQGWTPAEAVRTLRVVQKYQIQFCEQPVVSWDWAGMKFVRDHVDIPIMADESVHVPHDLIEGIRREAIDMVNIKVMKAGGLMQSARIAQIADAADMNCMLGCMQETRVGLTAAAHVVASQKNILYADLDAFLIHSFDPVIGGMEVKDGQIHLPPAPGLGLDVDPTFLRQLRAA
ncbi:MAG: dipeptide epimerase [Terriglobales bacterium]|jgi:L-alanine-DL-glutamate epimerase-like enolase superfamily enzyme